MIGIFDSGIGGLTVVKEIFKQLPGYQIIYFGDTARAPYGNKSPQTVIRYSKENTDFLLKQGAKVIVVGCNTASALATEELKKQYPDVPIFEVITPAVKRAVEVTKNKRIGVIGTRATINSGVYAKKIKELDPRIKVFSQAGPLFVPLVEENWIKRPEAKMIARRYLQGLKTKSIDTLILGCTHYPLLKQVISAKIGARVNLVDSAEEAVKKITNYKPASPELQRGELPITNIKKGSHRFYVSDVSGQATEIAKRWLGREIVLEEVDLDH